MFNDKPNICNDCQNQNICKWGEEFQRVIYEVNKIPFDKIYSPITAKVACNSFQRKNQKQDGFFNRVQGNR